MTELQPTSENELQLLEALELTPVTSQADLAAQVGVAVGTVNWYLKRWSKKGYVKVKRIGRWQWSYLLTADGMARKAQLAGKYVEASMALYRRTRTEARRLLEEVQAAGYETVHIDGQGEIAEICALTCLEMGLVNGEYGENRPSIRVEGTGLLLILPAQVDREAEGQ